MDRREQRRGQTHRRRTWRVLAVVTVVGALLLVGFDAWLRHMAEVGLDDPDRAINQVAMAAALINLVIAALAFLLARFLYDWARQSREQGQWPPAGLQLLGQGPIQHGEDARRTAARLRLAGHASIVLGLAVLAWAAWRLVA